MSEPIVTGTIDNVRALLLQVAKERDGFRAELDEARRRIVTEIVRVAKIAREREALRDQLYEAVTALRELDGNCENQRQRPFISYVRTTCRAALARIGGNEVAR